MEEDASKAAQPTVTSTRREKVLKKMEEASALEKEIQEHVAFLTQPGFPGLAGGLIDSEGFPRNDIDVYTIRTVRSRLATAQYDLKAIMQEVEQGLHAIHADISEGRNKGDEKHEENEGKGKASENW